MKIESDKIIFSSGNTVYAYEGIIGITPDLCVTEGYHDTLGLGDELSKEDATELANYMIEQWTKFKEKSMTTA